MHAIIIYNIYFYDLIGRGGQDVDSLFVFNGSRLLGSEYFWALLEETLVWTGSNPRSLTLAEAIAEKGWVRMGWRDVWGWVMRTKRGGEELEEGSGRKIGEEGWEELEGKVEQYGGREEVSITGACRIRIIPIQCGDVLSFLLFVPTRPRPTAHWVTPGLGGDVFDMFLRQRAAHREETDRI